MKLILHIVGNRPQLVKLAVLHKELAGAGLFDQKIIHTGQHFSYKMSDLFFKELNIPAPDLNLNINNLPANQFIIKAANELEHYFTTAGKCIVFVYGDTNTTHAAAIAAKRAGIFLVHFEAGVRTGDMMMPEEINRLLTDRLADINLCCTSTNYANMQEEGYGSSIPSKIYLSGDLMLDAFNKIEKSQREIVPEKKYVACTIHRAANVYDKASLQQITGALNTIHESIPVIVPLHPNTKKMMHEFGCQPAFKVIEPLGYPDMKSFLTDADFVITDSGGTCREAYFLHKKALILMQKPFWPEIIEQECALSCSSDNAAIIKNFFALPGLTGNFETPIFGDGHAAAKIKRILAAVSL